MASRRSIHSQGTPGKRDPVHSIRPDGPTPTIEEYLKAIHALEQTGLVRPTRIAEAMGVSGPTVTVTLRRLKEAGLVERAGRGVRLTESGRRHAVSVIERHDIAERFLEGVLGLPRDEALREACRLEHALSPQVAEAISRLIDGPRSQAG